MEGVLVSTTGRAQRLRPGARGPEDAAAAWELLIALSHRVGKPAPVRTPAQAFAAAAAANPALSGMTTNRSAPRVRSSPTPATDVSGSAVAHREPEGDGLLLVSPPRSSATRSLATAPTRSRRSGRPPRSHLAPGPGAAHSVCRRVSARESPRPYGSCELTVADRLAAPEGVAFVSARASVVRRHGAARPRPRPGSRHRGGAR